MKSPLTTGNLEIKSRKTVDVQDRPWIERRARARFRLVFPVIFHWSDGAEHSAVGYCRNIGLGGIFIVTSNCPPVDMELDIDVVAPAFDSAPGEILLRHTGRLIRIQTCNDLLGFAVAGGFEKKRITRTRARVAVAETVGSRA